MPIIIFIFAVCAVVTWLAGITLTKTTNSLDSRFHLGDALGGMILLGITSSLPELAVTFAAAKSGHFSIVLGNLLGALAIKTLLIVIFDYAIKKKPLSLLVSTPIVILEVIFAIVLAIFALIGIFLPKELAIFHLNPASILILVSWIVGLFIINKARRNPKLYLSHELADPGRSHTQRRQVENHPFYKNKTNTYVILIFVFAALISLVAGVFLEKTGSLIAGSLGISEGIFAATIIALVCSLPEISAGLESIWIGDNQLAVSDIMGGNSFILIGFIFADFIVGQPVLSLAGNFELTLLIIGIVMMAIYAVFLFLKIKKQFFRLGLDSILEIIVYIIGAFILTSVR